MYLYLCFCFWAEAASFRLLGIKRLFRPCCLGGWVLSVGSTYSPLYPHCEREFEAGGGFPARYLFWQDLPCCGGPRVLPRLACLRWWDRLTGAPWTGVTGKGVNRLPEPSCLCVISCCAVCGRLRVFPGGVLLPIRPPCWFAQLTWCPFRFSPGEEWPYSGYLLMLGWRSGQSGPGFCLLLLDAAVLLLQVPKLVHLLLTNCQRSPLVTFGYFQNRSGHRLIQAILSGPEVWGPVYTLGRHFGEGGCGGRWKRPHGRRRRGGPGAPFSLEDTGSWESMLDEKHIHLWVSTLAASSNFTSFVFLR